MLDYAWLLKVDLLVMVYIMDRFPDYIFVGNGKDPCKRGYHWFAVVLG